MAKVISIVNNKGGVGKTTTAVNLADALSREGMRVLVLDIDPQANTSSTIGLVSPYKVKRTMVDLLLDDSVSLPAAIESPTKVEGVDLVYGHIHLTSADEKLRMRSLDPARELANKLKGAINAYDIVLIDIPPQLSMLTANALAASSHYIIPVESGSQYSLEGMDELIRYVNRILKIQPELKRLGILLTKHDGRKKVCRIVSQAVSEEYPDVFRTQISNNTLIAKSELVCKTVLQIDRRANVSREYVDLAREILERLGIASQRGIKVDEEDRDDLSDRVEAGAGYGQA